MIVQKQISNAENYLIYLQKETATWKFKMKSMITSLPFNTFEFPIKSMELKYKGKFFKLNNKNAIVQG